MVLEAPTDASLAPHTQSCTCRAHTHISAPTPSAFPDAPTHVADVQPQTEPLLAILALSMPLPQAHSAVGVQRG